MPQLYRRPPAPLVVAVAASAQRGPLYAAASARCIGGIAAASVQRYAIGNSSTTSTEPPACQKDAVGVSRFVLLLRTQQRVCQRAWRMLPQCQRFGQPSHCTQADGNSQALGFKVVEPQVTTSA
jgi:hypothetical protein